VGRQPRLPIFFMTDNKHPVYVLIPLLALFFILLIIGAIFIEIETVKSAIHHFFSVFCHQQTSLSIHIAGEKMPVCSRCLGMHLGFFTASSVIYLLRKKIGNLWIKKEKTIISLFVCSWLLISFSAWLANKSILMTSHMERSATGLLAGITSALLLFYLIEKIYRMHKDRQNP